MRCKLYLLTRTTDNTLIQTESCVFCSLILEPWTNIEHTHTHIKRHEHQVGTQLFLPLLIFVCDVLKGWLLTHIGLMLMFHLTMISVTGSLFTFDSRYGTADVLQDAETFISWPVQSRSGAFQAPNIRKHSPLTKSMISNALADGIT